MNSFGKMYRLTSFGESHGEAIGGVIDGCPAGIPLSIGKIQDELDRRRPGRNVSSLRNEPDRVEIFSGLYEEKTTGMPIGFIIRNTDARSRDYDRLKDIYRPSHADFSWQKKYGVYDHRGSGRASAREHAVRVVGGAVAKQILEKSGVMIQAYTSRIGEIGLERKYNEFDLNELENSDVWCPDKSVSDKMIALIERIRREGDTIGCIVECVIRNVPSGLGEPVFGRLSAQLSCAMLSINAAKGFEYGAGFGAAAMRGSVHNDAFSVRNGKIGTKTNFSGGIQGGISNGEDIFFRVAFKPLPTLMQEQIMLTHDGREVAIKPEGRHDVCAVPRVIPVVEAMSAMTILDALLIDKTCRM